MTSNNLLPSIIIQWNKELKITYLWDIQMEEKIRIVFKGKNYTGNCSIKGVRKLRQTISYGLEQRADGHTYDPTERAIMKSVAKVILRELVEEDLREQ